MAARPLLTLCGTQGASRILLPYRVHGLGVAETVAEVNQVVGTVGNPVTGLSITGDVLTITFADQTTGELTLPAGTGDMVSGTDQTARDAAETAQERADAAFTNAETAQQAADANATNISDNADAITALPTPFDWAQEGNSDEIPAVKISSAVRGTKVHVSTSLPATGLLGDIVILDLTTTSPSIYEWGTSGWQLDYTFQGGRVHVVTSAHNIAMQSPVANGGDILFELVGGTLKMYRRLNANNAPFWQYYGEVAGGGGVDQAAFDTHTANANAHHVPPTGGGIFDGERLPGVAVAMRIGWGQTADFVAANYVRADNHPLDGVSVGTTAGLLVPPFPPALASDDTLYLGIWVAYTGDVPIRQFPSDPITFEQPYFSAPVALTVEGVVGQSYTLHDRLDADTYADHGNEFFLTLPGELIASQPWVTTQLAGAGGPVKIGNWSGDLVADTWTATAFTWPTTALVGIGAVHTIVFDGVTAVGWPIGWYDSAAVGAHRYNFRLANGAAFGWIRKTSGGLIEVRSGQNRTSISFDFWSL